MTNGFDARIPEKAASGAAVGTAAAFAKTVSYPFLLTPQSCHETAKRVESSHGTFDLLETRVVELLGQIDTLGGEENKSLQEKVNALDEENKTLKESLEQEQHTKEEINGRIDTLLSTIREFTAEA